LLRLFEVAIAVLARIAKLRAAIVASSAYRATKHAAVHGHVHYSAPMSHMRLLKRAITI
jgi:hypothetical protein